MIQKVRNRPQGCALRPLVVLLLLWTAVEIQGETVFAQQPREVTASLFGRVLDEAEQPISSAALRLLGPTAAERRTVIADAEGRYRLVGLSPGRYRLGASHLGYAAEELEITLRAGESRRLDFQLRIAALPIEGIAVRTPRDVARERARFEQEAGVTARVVTREELKLLPGLAEADVMRALEMLPGVISTSDFSSAFNVRGGSADQNLILLDGFPIFNPFHLGGLFSVFNADALARAELFAGGFSAEYGGRVSSVLTVESRSTEGEGFGGTAGVSILASRVALHGDLPPALPELLGGEGGTWVISGRRSYFDKVLSAVVDFPYHLTDVQGHLSLGITGGGRLQVTGYTGADVLDLSDFGSPGGEGDSDSVLRLRWNWGNDVLGVRWEQPLGRGTWLADTRLGFSRFREQLGFTDFGDTRFASGISQLTLRSDLGRELGSALTVRTGVELSHVSYDNSATAGGTQFLDRTDSGILGSSYATFLWRPDDRWLVEPGLRLDVWGGSEATYTTLSPRFAIKRFFGEEREGAVKLAAGRYTQFLHSLRNEEFPLSNDVWILAGESVPAVVSDQLQLGIERFWGEEWYASAEVYGRLFRGVTEFNPANDPNDPADDLHAGTGRSYGLDLLVRRSAGRLTGWTTLSLLRAERTFPNVLAEGWDDLPPTVSFPPIWDRRIDLDLILQYQLPWEIEAGARWNYGSGLPYTRPVGQFVGLRHDLVDGGYRLPDSPQRQNGVPLYVVLGGRNVERYPAYHRLDLSVRRSFRPRWGTWTPYLQVLNVYDRRNVLFYFYNYDRMPPTRSGVSMFPVLPTVGVEVSF